MKIAFISKDSRWQNYRAEMLKKLADEYGVEITVHTTGHIQPQITGSRSVRYASHRSWLPASWKPAFFPGALISIARERPDAILALPNLSHVTEMISLPLCRLLGIRFVWWTHAYDHAPSRSRIARAMKERLVLALLRCADAVVTFSPQGREYLLQKGLPASQVLCAPNTLDTDQLLDVARKTRDRGNRPEILRSWCLPLTARIVLFSGRMQARKRIDDAILAMARVVQQIPDAHFVLIGDGPERRRLQHLAERVVPKHTTFYGALYDDNRLAELFTVAEVFVMPAWVGLAIVHAFAFGLPIVTERVRHPPEIQYLKENVNGFLVDEGDTEAMAIHICQLLSDSNLRDAMAAAAISTAQNEASICRMLRSMARALAIDEPL